MKTMKRIISILFSLALILGLMPGMTLTAYADDYVAKVGETEYTTLGDAISAWGEDTTLTLLADVTITDLISVGQNKTLDLNGHTITFNRSGGTQRVIQVEAGNKSAITFNLIDSSGTNAGKITGINATDDWSGPLYVGLNATVNMYGGTITGNNAAWGGGVWLDSRYHGGSGANGGTFNMYGGVITGNTASEYGGGVSGKYHTANNCSQGSGRFNMYGGIISGNNAPEGKDVYIGEAVMTMTGGTIGEFSDSNYTAVTFNANGGTGTMSDQYVRKNTDTIIKDNVNYGIDGIKTDPAFSRAGYTFDGWNTAADGSGTDYAAGTSTINISEPISLYAKWIPVDAIAPTISAQPQNTDLTYGYTDGSVSVTASAEEGHTLSYQWYSCDDADKADPKEVSGATEADCTIPTGKNAGTTEYYYCVVTATRTDNGRTATVATDVATVTVNKADSVPGTVTPNNRIYDGSDKALVTVDRSTLVGGTMQYALGKDSKTAPSKGWSTSIPTGTDAGTYYVWYKVKGDENHNDSGEKCVTVTIKGKISAKVTFKVEGGSWNDGEGKAATDDRIVTLTGTEGDTLKLSEKDIPKAGSRPNEGYKEGQWDVTPSTSVAITKDVTYTYTYAKAASKAAKVTKAPKAKKLSYNGKDQKLVTKGTASNGKMYYAVTKKAKAPKASAYKTSIPTGKDAGTYYVWYKAKGNTGYKDSAVRKIKVTIAKKATEPKGFNTSFKCEQTEGKYVISWTKQSNVAKVEAYVTCCGVPYPKTPIKTDKDHITVKNINDKKIDLKENFKVYLIGYDSKGKKVGKTFDAHFVGKNNKYYTNVKSFKLNKKAVTLQKGKNTKIKMTSVKLEDPAKKEITKAHGAKVRFRSDNPGIAKVDKKGKITGVSEGTCTVYVYARDGLSRKVKVTVTK